MALYAIAFSTIGAAATWYTMTRNGLGFYSDEESLKAFATTDEEARRAETIINTHPLVAQLRKRPDLTESRPHLKMPKEYRQRSLTGGALTGPGYMVVPPYAWNDSKGAEMVLIGYVGSDLCGHPGIVHGGFLATMLDEALGRCSFASLPYKIAVTANLNVNYRKPTPANSFLVLRAETVKAEGRKAWMKGRIESLVEPGQTPVVYAEATALFISPKYAAVRWAPFFPYGVGRLLDGSLRASDLI